MSNEANLLKKVCAFFSFLKSFKNKGEYVSLNKAESDMVYQ